MQVPWWAWVIIGIVLLPVTIVVVFALCVFGLATIDTIRNRKASGKLE